MLSTRFWILTALIATAAATRLLPHPPNFAPIAAMALFGGATMTDRRMAFLVPMAAMFMADLFIGLHILMPLVYASFAITVLLGFWLRPRIRPSTILAAALASSILFFLVTNFGVWVLFDSYPHTWAGLGACYVAAIPYFRNTLAGDLIYSGVLFGGFALLQARLPAIAGDPSQSA